MIDHLVQNLDQNHVQLAPDPSVNSSVIHNSPLKKEERKKMDEPKDQREISSSSQQLQTVTESQSRDDQHMSLSSPESSPFHSRHNSGVSDDHISPSPHDRSPSSITVDQLSSPESDKPHSPGKQPSAPAPVVERDAYEETSERRVASADEPSVVVSDKNEPPVNTGDGGGGVRRRRYRYKPSLSILRSVKREETVRKAGLVFRVFGFLFCLISFTVMSADRKKGWALDSFDNYIEFRYCMSVNVIGFVYSGAQAFDLSYKLATGKRILQLQQNFRQYFDFAGDQVIAYLLISASSSASIRIDDWKLNWGKHDKFPDMAIASVSMSFLAFAAIASSSLLSGFALCTSSKNVN